MSETVTTVSWDDVKVAKVGTIFVDRFEDGLRFILLRGPFHLCAYVGIPSDHPLAGHSYDDLPVNAHGGLTYGAEGKEDGFLPAGFYWYGWDYGHCDDYMISDHHSDRYDAFNESHKKWGVSEVESDSWQALYDFRHLIKLAESIAQRKPSVLGRD